MERNIFMGGAAVLLAAFVVQAALVPGRVLLPQQLEVQAIAVLVAVACALPGVFLVLRRMALLSDAISHAILLGIVLAYFVTRDLQSPWLIVGAAATGVVTVMLVELLNRTRLVREDAAIGLVFPVMFSIAVILIYLKAGNIHLDTDAVLLGALELAPFQRTELPLVGKVPLALVVTAVLVLVNLTLIVVFFKELKLSTFDAGLAASLGFTPALLHYGLMTVVSVTAVGSFEAVGSILVVAFMIGPPAAAYLLSDRLKWMLALSAVLGGLAALTGYWLARVLDASIAGSMTTMIGVVFVLTLLLAPERGLIVTARRRARQRWEFAQTMLTIHLHHHEGTAEAVEENNAVRLPLHLRWTPVFAAEVIERSERMGLLRHEGPLLVLTEAGRERARTNLRV